MPGSLLLAAWWHNPHRLRWRSFVVASACQTNKPFVYESQYFDFDPRRRVRVVITIESEKPRTQLGLTILSKNATREAAWREKKEVESV